jgi:N6-adenosine-specific RNA methylase IME4
MKYRTIVADPPWQQPLTGRRAGRHVVSGSLPYPTMTLEQIKRLRVGDMAEDDAHLWLWTTNAFLRQGFDVMEAWGFKYLAPVTWVKPSGMGNYFAHRSQTLLFGYRKRCLFPLARYRSTVLVTNTTPRHSRKPDEAYALIEAVSPGPRLELFARPPHRLGWDVWGNESANTAELEAA